MKKCSCILFYCLIILYTPYSHAYQNEVTTGLGVFDSGNRSATDFLVEYNYYFKSIDQYDVPYAEAAFLNHASSLYGSYFFRDEEIAGEDFNIDNSRSEFLIGSVYNHRQLNFNGGVKFITEEQRNSTVIFFLGGIYLEPDFRVQLGFSNFTSDDPNFESDLRFLVEAKKIMKFKGKYLALEARFVFDGDTRRDSDFAIAVDYYFDQSLSAGVFIEKAEDGIVMNDSAVGFRGSWFITSLLGLEVTYHGLGNDFNELFFNVRGRFD